MALENNFSSAEGFVRSYIAVRREVTQPSTSGWRMSLEAVTPFLSSWSFLYLNQYGRLWTRSEIGDTGFSYISEDAPHIFKAVYAGQQIFEEALRRHPAGADSRAFEWVIGKIEALAKPGALAENFRAVASDDQPAEMEMAEANSKSEKIVHLSIIRLRRQIASGANAGDLYRQTLARYTQEGRSFLQERRPHPAIERFKRALHASRNG